MGVIFQFKNIEVVLSSKETILKQTTFFIYWSMKIVKSVLYMQRDQAMKVKNMMNKTNKSLKTVCSTMN